MRNPFTRKLRESIESLEEYSDALRDYNKELRHRVDVRDETILLLTDTVNKLRDDIEKMSISNEAKVTLVFAPDNYEHVTPIITTTPDSFEQLFTIRAIDDTQEENINAIRLSMLNLAAEALEQLCSDFVGEIE